MTALMLKLTPLLALFGFGGKKGHSRFGFVPQGYIGVVTRFDKIVYHRCAPPKYRVMRWRRTRQPKHWWTRCLRWNGFNAKIAGQPKLRHPGFNWTNIPLLDKTHHVSMMKQSKKLENQPVQLNDQTFFIVNSIVRFRVKNPVRVAYELDDFDSQLKDYCEMTLMSVLSKLSSAQLQKVDETNTKLLAAITKFAGELGVKFEAFGLSKSDPTKETAAIIQMRRLIDERVEGIVASAGKLSGTDTTAAIIASGSSFISSGGISAMEDSPAHTSSNNLAVVVPIQSVPDPSS